VDGSSRPHVIATHLTRECARPGRCHSYGRPDFLAKNVADLEYDSSFRSDWRATAANTPHTPNSSICCDFKKRRVGRTHHVIRSNNDGGWTRRI
jgi:hypothetical protein